MNKKTRLIIGFSLLGVGLLGLIIIPAILFTLELRGLFTFNISTLRIYLITQLGWIGVIVIGMLVLGGD